MNETVKASIKGRLDAIYNGYEINNEDIKNKIDDLFKRIEEFGLGCSDANDFETKFAMDALNQEYINLFTQVATCCPCQLHPVEDNHDAKSNGEVIAENAASDVKYMVDDLTQPMRHQAYQETYDAARDVPVLGEAMNVKQHFDFFSRFRKKKDENDE